jgi:hypothetical protein
MVLQGSREPGDGAGRKGWTGVSGTGATLSKTPPGGGVASVKNGCYVNGYRVGVDPAVGPTYRFQSVVEVTGSTRPGTPEAVSYDAALRGPLEGAAVPPREVCAGLVGRLQKLEQGLIRAAG